MFKNTASQKIAVFAFDTTTGAPKTGDASNISVYLSKDWGSVTQLADTSATEMDATNAKGWYLFDVSQTESNADAMLFTGKSSTTNISIVGQIIYTLPPNFSTLLVDSTGHAGIDWANVSNTGTANNLSATRIQTVNALAAGTDSINTIATSGSTLTTGSSVSGTYASTSQLDGTYWQIADTAGTLDMYFEFNVGSVGIPTTIEWVGGLTTAVNTLKVYAYNWGSTTFEQIGTVSGTTSLIANTQSFDLTTSHVGTGGNVGLVRLRFQNTGLTSANFYTDRVICGYTSVYTFPTNFSSLSIDGSGRIDLIKINGTSQTARDVGASVLLSSGTGTGQLDFTSGVVKSNSTQWLGGTIPAVNVTGVPLVDLKYTLGTISPATAGSVRADAVTGAVGSVTGLTASNLDATISSRLAAASYTAQSGDAYAALVSTTRAEPGQGNPPATTTPLLKIDYLFKAFRNKVDQTATGYKLYADDSATVDQKATVSDDGTTFTRTKIVTGP